MTKKFIFFLLKRQFQKLNRHCINVVDTKKRREKEYFSPFAQSFLRHRALHRDWFIVLFHSPFFTHSTHFFLCMFQLRLIVLCSTVKKSSHHQFLFVIAHLTIDYYLLDHYWWWWWRRRWGEKEVSLQTQYLSPISFIFQLTWILTQSHSYFLTSLITNSNILQMQFLLIKYLWIFCLISPFNGTRIGNLRFAKCFFFSLFLLLLKGISNLRKAGRQ